MEKIKCVAYCRVSTDSKDQENSLENQKSYFEREISKNEKYEFVGTYHDKGISGTKLNRPGFDKMLYDAGLDIVRIENNDKDKRKEKIKYVTIASTSRKPKFDRIFVKNTSRFARNILVEQIIRDLAQNNVYVHFLDLNKCTEKSEDSTFIQIFLSFDERESRDKSKKIIFGIEESAKRGKINAGSGGGVYGYKYIRDNNCLEIVENEAKVVREIFKLYSENKGIRSILNYLNDKGIKTRRGKEFSQNAIRYMLQNEKYIGFNIRRKYTYGEIISKNSYAKLRPKDDWINMGETDKIPPIINKELFYKCEQLRESKVSSVSRKGIYRGKTEYARLIYCSKCGQPYISNTDGKKKFYNCKARKNKGIKACDNPHINVELLNNATSNAEYISELFAMRTVYVRELKKLISTLRERINNHDIEKNEEARYKIEELNRKMMRYGDLYVDESFNKEELDLRIAPIKNEIDRLQKMVKELGKENDELFKDINAIEETINEINSKEIKLSYSRQEILNDIEKIIIHEDKEIEVRYKSVMLLRKLKEKHSLLDLEIV